MPDVQDLPSGQRLAYDSPSTLLPQPEMCCPSGAWKKKKKILSSCEWGPSDALHAEAAVWEKGWQGRHQSPWGQFDPPAMLLWSFQHRCKEMVFVYFVKPGMNTEKPQKQTLASDETITKHIKTWVPRRHSSSKVSRHLRLRAGRSEKNLLIHAN